MFSHVLSGRGPIGRLIPQTTLGQIVIIIIGALVMTFSVSFGVLMLLRPVIPPRPMGPMENAVAVAASMHALGAVPPENRDALAKAISMPRFRVTLTDGDACDVPTQDSPKVMELLRPLLTGPAAGYSVSGCAMRDDGSDPVLQVLVPLGTRWVDFRLSEPPPPGLLPFAITLTVALFFLLFAVTGLTIWAAWRIIDPLRRLADTVEAFGTNIVAAPLPEHGPREIRQAARAFNRMQNAITSFVHDRSRMLAAISHDLRTPLTRLKLRVELEATGTVRETMMRDIAQLQAMVDTALVFLQGQTVSEEKDWIDLSALVATICDEFEEIGVTVSYENNPYLPCLCQPLAMRRAITNLIENARQYGTTVSVTTRQDGDLTIIEVIDDGPGIPNADKQRALQPFSRLEEARVTTKGNVGLGLAIVNDTARAHGGTLELLDRMPRGLVVRLSIATRSTLESGRAGAVALAGF